MSRLGFRVGKGQGTSAGKDVVWIGPEDQLEDPWDRMKAKDCFWYEINDFKEKRRSGDVAGGEGWIWSAEHGLLAKIIRDWLIEKGYIEG